MKGFAGEFSATIGPFEFSVSDEGHWDVDFTTNSSGARRKSYISMVSGKTISLKRAKMRCERFARTLVAACRKLGKQ